MRVTKQEVADATGLQDVEGLTELTLANKYVHEVGFVAKMRDLCDLNLAFNELESIDDLCRNTELCRLNVAHNKLRSLAGIESMAQLRSIRASNNRLRGVQPLAACRSLEECWLQQNKLADLVAVVDTLRALPKLRNLVLMGNPCCDRAEYRAWVISQLPSLQLLDGQDVAEERATLGDGPTPQLGRLKSTDLEVVDHSGSSDEDSDAAEADGDREPKLRRGEWTVTDARGQKVHMAARKNKHTKKDDNTADGTRRRSGVAQARDYDYGLLQQGGEAPSCSPQDELRQALAGLRKWTEAALPVVERFTAAITVSVAPHEAGASVSARARSRSRHTPIEQARESLASHRKTANAATETCRRLQRAAAHAVSEAAPSLRLAEEMMKQVASKETGLGRAGKTKHANGGGSANSPRGSPDQRRRKRSGRRAASVQSHTVDGAYRNPTTRSVSNSRGRNAGNELEGRATGSTPRSPQGVGRRPKSTGRTSRTGSNTRGSSSRGQLSRTNSSSRRSTSTAASRRERPRQPPPQPPQRQPQQQQVKKVSAAALALDQAMSDSDSGSDSDLETIGLAAAARASRTNKARNGKGLRSQNRQMRLSPQQTKQRLQTAAEMMGTQSGVSTARGTKPGGAEASSSQYVPATVELLAAQESNGKGVSHAGAYSWHAAAAEFGAAESSLGRTELSGAAGEHDSIHSAGAGGAPLGVRAVASDPIHADGPLHNANIVRGSIAIVQRGVCTFLEKARRVQEAGGIGVIFVNSGETLFVPHGTEDDPGGDIRIPAVCLRKKDGDMLLAIASLGHQGAAQITMTF